MLWSPKFLVLIILFGLGFFIFDTTIGNFKLYSLNASPLTITTYKGDASTVKAVDEIADNALFFYKVTGQQFVTNIDQLKNYGSQTLAKPYMDSWYPEATGGTNANGALTRYDNYFSNGQTLAATWESTYHHDLTETWYGHCNGYSASVTRHLEAKNPVYRPSGCNPASSNTCVQYSPEDIKAMLVEIYMDALSRFVGGKRCETGCDNMNLCTPQTRTDPTIKSPCEGLDPGVMHVSLLNWMGKQGNYVIGNFFHGNQVWNYPIYSYSVSYINNGNKLTAAQAATSIWGSTLTTFIFNPAAVSFVGVDLTVNYADVSTSPATGTYAQKLYHYVLELDAQDNVIGGEWVGSSINQHPDFIWLAFPPVDQSGSAPGSRQLGNYYVKSASVIELWAESMGFDQQNPFSDPKNTLKVLSLPQASENWGHYDPFFSIVLDGRTNGIAFSGKKLTLTVHQLSLLPTNVALNLQLNGQAVGTYQLTAGQDTAITFNAGLGINNLQFDWTRNGEAYPVAAQTVPFFVM